MGARRGLRPHNHPLFRECLVQADDRQVDATELEGRRFCDALRAQCGRPGVWRVELQTGAGLSTFYALQGLAFAPAFLNEAVESCVHLLDQREA